MRNAKGYSIKLFVILEKYKRVRYCIANSLDYVEVLISHVYHWINLKQHNQKLQRVTTLFFHSPLKSMLNVLTLISKPERLFEVISEMYEILFNHFDYFYLIVYMWSIF